MARAPTGVSQTGRDFIKRQEGFSLKPYPDAAGHSIYWGHYIRHNETFAGTMEDAEAVFARDLGEVSRTIRALVRVPLTQPQFDALGDFVYNVGAGRFAKSALLRKLNAGDYAGAAREFSRFAYSRGRKVPKLATRRAEEQALFSAIA